MGRDDDLLPLLANGEGFDALTRRLASESRRYSDMHRDLAAAALWRPDANTQKALVALGRHQAYAELLEGLMNLKRG
jgi:hypothetical protein